MASTEIPPPDPTNTAHPTNAKAVATTQRTPGLSPRKTTPRIPAHTGALPMAAMVPIATPVFDIPPKKNGW